MAMTYQEALKTPAGIAISGLKLSEEINRKMLVSAGILQEEVFTMDTFTVQKGKDVGKQVKVVKIKGQFRGLALSTIKVISQNLEQFAKFCDDYKDTIQGSAKEPEVQ